MATKIDVKNAVKNLNTVEWHLDMKRDAYSLAVNRLAEQEERAENGLPPFAWNYTAEDVKNAEAKLLEAIEMHWTALDTAIETERQYMTNPRRRR